MNFLIVNTDGSSNNGSMGNISAITAAGLLVTQPLLAGNVGPFYTEHQDPLAQPSTGSDGIDAEKEWQELHPKKTKTPDGWRVVNPDPFWWKPPPREDITSFEIQYPSAWLEFPEVTQTVNGFGIS